MKKINLKDNDKCTFCMESVELIDHIFLSCPKTAEIWEDHNLWIYEKTHIELLINFDFVIFGFLHKSDMNVVRNIIILLSKFYIYRTKLDSRVLNVTALKDYLRENMYIEKQIYCNNKILEKSQTCWTPLFS